MLMMTERQARLSPALRKKIPLAVRPTKSNAARSIEHAIAVLLPTYTVQSEFRFHPARRWRFDWAIPELMLAIELEGVGGLSRHTTIAGYTRDCEKYTTAAALGWCVFRFTQRQAMAKNFQGTLDALLGLRGAVWRRMV